MINQISLQMLTDNVGVFKKVFDEEWCYQVRKLMNEKIEHAENCLPDDHDGNSEWMGISFRKNEKRIDTSLLMERFGSLQGYEEELKSALQQCLILYDNEVWGKHMEGQDPGSKMGWSWKHIERIQCKMQRTPPGGGFCQMHFEQGPDYFTSRRFGVWMLYLNTVDDGGTTDFPNQNMRIKPSVGDLVIWPAAYTHPHRSSPDLGQFKYIITGWFIYKDPDDEKNTVPFEKSRFNVV